MLCVELSMVGTICDPYGTSSIPRKYSRTRTIRFRTFPDCAINRPNKNHVGLRISQVNPATPTTHTARQTIQNFLCKTGIALRDSAKVPSSPDRKSVV